MEGVKRTCSIVSGKRELRMVIELVYGSHDRCYNPNDLGLYVGTFNILLLHKVGELGPAAGDRSL